MKAKKSFGQHFLINEPLAEKIANSLTENLVGQNVLEIGPGKGVLTKYLLKQTINLRVVEADQDMVTYLQKHYPEVSDKIIFMDFLKLSMTRVFEGESFKIIGNFPYNISSQILIKMVNHRDIVPELVGMFQKEVAERVVAPPGSKTYGVISVLVQAYYQGSLILKVSPGSFNPPPKVDSAVIRLIRKENQHLGCDDKWFRIIVKTSFNQRRKMLRNTLKPLVSDEGVLSDPLFEKRPEQLSVEQFVLIVNRLFPYLKQISHESRRKDQSGSEGSDEA